MKNEKSKCICVPLKDAENIRKYLIANNILRKDLKINKDGKSICFPILDKSDRKLSNYIASEGLFKRNKIKNISYKEKLKYEGTPENIHKTLPTSFDIIGDILLIKLDDNLSKYYKEIGKALLNSHKNVKVVCLTKPVRGELRTRRIKIIAGEDRSTTTHKEYGLNLNLDIRKTYFSPRLANERIRVTKLVKPKEVVVDMFAGVAPFSIMIAKYSSPRIVYAIDKNPYAVKYAKINVKINNVLDKVKVIKADAKDTPKIIKEKADRIIMNLPFSAYLFFKQALKIANDCCYIHYFDILKEEEIKKRVEFLKKTALKAGFTLEKIDVGKIKTYAPREFYIRIDITAKKMPM